MKCIKCGKDAIALVENKVYSDLHGMIFPKIYDWLCLEGVCEEHYQEYRKEKKGS